MSDSTAANPITGHLAACTRLRRDARAVIDELRLQTIADAEHRLATQYAVDFSEVYSLIFPQKTAAEMRVFEQTAEVTSRTVQLDALRYLFYDGPHQPLLLVPYAVEFRSVIERLRTNLLADTIQNAMASWQRMEQILRVPDINAIIEAGTRGTLTDGEILNLWEVFEKHAAELLVLTEHEPDKPLALITELIQSGKLRDLPSKASYPPDDVVRQRWFEKLHDLRGPEKDGASYVDAVAMATIHRVNKTWTREGRRLVLITRSEAMHAVFESEYDEQLWDDAGGYVVRHPRTFTSLYHSAPSAHQLKEDLTQRQLSIELFMKSVEEKKIDPTKPLSPADDEWVTNEINNIRRAWEHTEVLASSEMLDHHVARVGTGRSKRARVTAVLTMLANREVFHEKLSARLTQLLTGIETQHEFFGFRLHADPHNDEQFIQPFLAGNKTVLRSTRYWVPFTLQFTSEALTQWAGSLQSSEEVDWREVIEFFRQGFGALDYERLLAMAYLLANLGKWGLAEEFCARSVQHPDSISARPHEAFYFLAICKRKNNFSLERFVEALDFLESAQNFKRLAVNDPRYKDPRYLAERGSQIYHAHRLARDNAHWHRQRLPRLSEACDLWHEALDLTKNDIRLTAQLHNNLAYYYALVEEPMEEQKARRHLNQLIETHCSFEPDMSRWNPLILDTIGLIRLKLRRTKRDDAMLEELAESIVAALPRLAMMPDDRKIVLGTLEKIDKALGNGRTHKSEYGRISPPPA